jgi:hypothetical protein
MIESTARLALPMLAAGQAYKEVTHNEALVRVDALLGAAIESFADAEPAAPESGQCWVIGPAPTGAWEQHSGQIALWSPGGWVFIEPIAGLIAWDRDRGHLICFDGSGWRTGGWPVGRLEIGGNTVVSARQPAISNPAGGSVVDVEARAGIAAILAALRSHGLIES